MYVHNYVNTLRGTAVRYSWPAARVSVRLPDRRQSADPHMAHPPLQAIVAETQRPVQHLLVTLY
jgi:hypothetical protein